MQAESLIGCHRRWSVDSGTVASAAETGREFVSPGSSTPQGLDASATMCTWPCVGRAGSASCQGSDDATRGYIHPPSWEPEVTHGLNLGDALDEIGRLDQKRFSP